MARLSSMPHWLFLLLASLLLLAVAAPLLHRVFGRRTGAVLALAPAAWLVVAARALPSGGAAAAEASYPWVPSLRLEFSLAYDGLSGLFTLLVLGIGALVLVYSDGYRGDQPRQGRFLGYLLLFMAAMLGVVLAADLLTLFVFWELTSVASYVLIGFEREREAARRAALRALLVTGLGGLALFAAALLTASTLGTVRIDEIVARRETLEALPIHGVLVILVALAAFTKSAQVPFHAWLPGAMEAPTPVSSYLHSATMVKAGVYLLARMSPAFGGTDLWVATLTAVGGVTLLGAGVVAVTARDVKQSLAYSTSATLGLMVLLLGVGTTAGLHAAVLLVLAHALYKASLFQVGGNVIHALGHGRLEGMGRLARAMPLTAAAGAAAALGMAGLAPAFGFIAKELALAAAEGSALLGVIGAGGILLAAVAVITGIKPFFAGTAVTGHPHEGGWALAAPPAILAAAGLLLGLAPWLAHAVAMPATSAVAGVPVAPLHLWHGINLALAVGVTSALAGITLAFTRSRWLPAAERLVAVLPDAERAYDGAVRQVFDVAGAVSARVQHGALPGYLLVTLASAAVVGSAPLVLYGNWPSLALSGSLAHEALLAAVIVAGSVTAAASRSRLLAIAALGAVGYAVALVFAGFGAPDLAMTQFAVETLSVVLLLLVLRGLPRFVAQADRSVQRVNLATAALVGALTTVLVLEATTVQWGEPVSGFFLERSLPEAFGRNVVNVVLVDFRALDTLGEITVLATAALGVWALMRLRPTREDTSWIR